MFTKPSSAGRLCVCSWFMALAIFPLACRKNDGTSSSASNAESADAYVLPTQPAGVTQITASQVLPKLENSGNLLAALHCEPEGFESRQGTPVIFSLRKPRAPDTALWIITVDPQTNAWRSTGEVAIVTPTGNEAVGPLYHFCDYGLTDIPVAIHERPHYDTEWLWLFSIYDRRLDDLARAVTEKYRGQLAVPANAYAPVVEWLVTESSIDLATITGEINGTPIDTPLLVRNTACLAAARAEFAARKKLLDTAYLQSFENWVTIAAGNGPEAAVAMWQAAIDIGLLREEKFSSSSANSRAFIFRQELSKAVGSRVAELLGTWSSRQLRDPLAASITDFIFRCQDDYAREKLASRSTGNVKDWLAGTFVNVLAGDGSEINLQRLGELLTRWGDALIDQAAWPDRPADPNSDFRKLLASPADGYLTSFALKWDYDNVLAKRFGSHKATAKIPGEKDHKARCTITLAEMRTLAGRAKIDSYDDSGGVPIAQPVSSLWILEYPALRKQLEATENDIRQHGNDGEKAWFDVVARANKPQSAAALRLLMYDLRTLMRNETVTVDEREKSMLRLSNFLIKSSARSTDAFLKPFAAVVHYYIKEYADYLWPSHLSQLIEILDTRCLRSAISLFPLSPVRPVYPNREKDVDAALAIDREQLPASCLPGK